MRWRIRTACCVLAAGWTAAIAAGQPTNPPPRPVEPAAPERVDGYALMDAYEAYGRPPVLVLAGFPGRSFSDGVIEASFGGFGYQLRTALEEVLNAPGVELDLIDSDAAAAAARRLSNALDAAGEGEAVRLLASELGADLVIFIKFLDRDPRKSPDARANLAFEAISTSRGRKIASFPFEWKLGTDVGSIKRTANALGVRFVREFAAKAGSPRRFDVRVIGLRDEPLAIRDFRSLLEGLRGTEGEVGAPLFAPQQDPGTGARETMATFRGVRFRGDSLDLAAGIAEAAAELDARVRLVGSETGVVTLRLVEKREAERVGGGAKLPLEECRRLILREGAEGAALRAQLGEVYRRNDSPRIAVLVERAATSDERERARGEGSGLSAQAMIVVQSGVGNIAGEGGEGGDARAREGDIVRLAETRADEIEHALYDRLGPRTLDLVRVDPVMVRARLLMSIEEGTGGLVSEERIVEGLRASDVADVVILGRGVWYEDAEGRATARYTFRAVRLSDAVYLGGASAGASLEAGAGVEAARVADEAMGRLACELLSAWSPPTPMAAVALGARDVEDMRVFLRTLSERALAGGSRVRVLGGPSFNGADSSFSVRLGYTCAPEELAGEIEDLSASIAQYSLAIERLTTEELVLSIER